MTSTKQRTTSQGKTRMSNDVVAETTKTKKSLEKEPTLAALDAELYKQATKFITSELDKVTLETINRDDLALDIIESDLNLILSVKEQYSNELTIEDKQQKVNEILETIQTEDKLSDIDRHILDLALESRLYAERSQKKKELILQFTSLFSGKVLKTNIKNTRTALLEAYKNSHTEDETNKLNANLKQARSNMIRRNQEQHLIELDKTAVHIVEKICRERKDDETSIALIRRALEIVFDNKMKQIEKKRKDESKDKQAVAA